MELGGVVGGAGQSINVMFPSFSANLATGIIVAYDPKIGDELWRVHHFSDFNVATRPLYAHGMVYVFTNGYTGDLLAVRPDGSGDVTDSHIAWSTTKGTPRIPSPIIVDDLMCLVASKGVARCRDARTGNEIWKKRLGGQYWACPLYANGQT